MNTSIKSNHKRTARAVGKAKRQQQEERKLLRKKKFGNSCALPKDFLRTSFTIARPYNKNAGFKKEEKFESSKKRNIAISKAIHARKTEEKRLSQETDIEILEDLADELKRTNYNLKMRKQDCEILKKQIAQAVNDYNELRSTYEAFKQQESTLNSLAPGIFKQTQQVFTKKLYSLMQFLKYRRLDLRHAKHTVKELELHALQLSYDLELQQEIIK